MYKSAMQLLLQLCYCLCIVISVPILSYGKDWRGITPMRSTRAQVEAILVEPTKDSYRNKVRSTYSLDEGEVSFAFADADIPAAAECLEKVPAGTVLTIRVTPKKQSSLSDLFVDQTKFRKFDPSDPPDIGYEAYINEQEGLIIRTHESKVDEIVYFATAGDQSLCPSYYANAESMVRIFVCGLGLGHMKFDEFGDLSSEDEAARLDNFAIQLQHQSEAVGYIIVYAGRRARVGEAYTRSKRVKEYLEGHRGMMGRVIAIDGGYREEFTIHLFVGPSDAAPPELSPTVEPSEVQIIDDQARPRQRRRFHP